MSVMPTTAARGLAPSRHVLANGLTVISKHTPVTPAVTINASIRAGAVCDPPDGGGLAFGESETDPLLNPRQGFIRINPGPWQCAIGESR